MSSNGTRDIFGRVYLNLDGIEWMDRVSSVLFLFYINESDLIGLFEPIVLLGLGFNGKLILWVENQSSEQAEVDQFVGA